MRTKNSERCVSIQRDEVGISEKLLDDPRILQISGKAFALWIDSVFWANRHCTVMVPKKILGLFKASKRRAHELVQVGLWGDEQDAFRILDVGLHAFGFEQPLDGYDVVHERDKRPRRERASRPVLQANYAATYARDKHACRYCRAVVGLSIDHVTPRSQGGSDAVSNLVVCCKACNARKGARTPEQAGMTLLENQ
jgi:hypothetical protein